MKIFPWFSVQSPGDEANSQLLVTGRFGMGWPWWQTSANEAWQCQFQGILQGIVAMFHLLGAFSAGEPRVGRLCTWRGSLEEWDSRRHRGLVSGGFQAAWRLGVFREVATIQGVLNDAQWCSIPNRWNRCKMGIPRRAWPQLASREQAVGQAPGFDDAMVNYRIKLGASWLATCVVTSGSCIIDQKWSKHHSMQVTPNRKGLDEWWKGIGRRNAEVGTLLSSESYHFRTPACC
jgi:hypothetical protein